MARARAWPRARAWLVRVRLDVLGGTAPCPLPLWLYGLLHGPLQYSCRIFYVLYLCVTDSCTYCKLYGHPGRVSSIATDRERHPSDQKFIHSLAHLRVSLDSPASLRYCKFPKAKRRRRLWKAVPFRITTRTATRANSLIPAFLGRHLDELVVASHW